MAGNCREAGQSMAKKIFVILRAIAAAADAPSPTDLAHSTEMPATTVARILRELEQQGAVQRTAGGRYEISLGIWRLGLRAGHIQRLRRVAMPIIQELHQLTGENVNLAALDNSGQVVTLEKVSGCRSWSVAGEIGATMPMHATAAGKVLLAHASPEVVRQVLSGELVRYTPFTITNPLILHEQLRRVRECGIGYAGEEMNLGSVSIAAPVWDDRVTVGAVSLVAQYRKERVPELVRLVKRTAEAASLAHRSDKVCEARSVRAHGSTTRSA